MIPRFVPLLALFATCCLPTLPPPVHVVVRDPVEEAEALTVAVFTKDAPVDDVNICGGVWVAPEWFITARHCTMDSDGIPVDECSYATNFNPGTSYPATVVHRALHADLALVHANGVVQLHPIATIARYTSDVGERLHMVGHVASLYWSFTYGSVASYRVDMHIMLGGVDHSDIGPFMQVQAPTEQGDSGSGAFNEAGQLVGIGDFVIEQAPGYGFYNTASTIQAFIDRSKL